MVVLRLFEGSIYRGPAMKSGTSGGPTPDPRASGFSEIDSRIEKGVVTVIAVK